MISTTHDASQVHVYVGDHQAYRLWQEIQRLTAELEAVREENRRLREWLAESHSR